RHALASGPIEEGFPPDYQERFSTVARQFAEHIRERNWKQTKYQIFFNDKYYYKDPARSPGTNGVSWWLLDEPNHHDDYPALSFFGWLGKRAPNPWRCSTWARSLVSMNPLTACASKHSGAASRTWSI